MRSFCETLEFAELVQARIIQKKFLPKQIKRPMAVLLKRHKNKLKV